MSGELIVGLVSASDRASGGVYKDEGIPALIAPPVACTRMKAYRR